LYGTDGFYIGDEDAPLRLIEAGQEAIDEIADRLGDGVETAVMHIGGEAATPRSVGVSIAPPVPTSWRRWSTNAFRG